MVSTLDSESNNPSSNLGRTFFTSFLAPQVFLQNVGRVLHRDRVVVVHESAPPLLLLLRTAQLDRLG